jgi:phospholipid/cholesterol/gamma-HCH transport system substrate-binding protein
MAQRKQLTWSELRVGVFIAMGIVLLVVAIFYVTSSEGMLSPKYRLVSYVGEIGDLRTGADVTLDGIVIGDVEDYRVNPADQPANPNRSIEIIMRINKKFQQDIRTDSLLTLDTEGLMGNRYVNITRGFTGTMLAANQEVPSQEEKGMKEIEERGAELAENLNTLAQQIQTIVTDVNKGRGTLGKLLNDDSVYNHLDSATSKIDSMIASVQAGHGTFGKLVASDDLYNKVNSATGRADDVLAAVQQQKGSLGKLIYDPALDTEATQLMQKGNAMLDDIHAGKGTLGKLATDDSLFQQWKQTGTNLSTLSSKLNQNDGTAGKFLNDPKLYDNLTELSGNMKLLMDDFRKNPKKYLTIRLNIF